MHRSLAAVLAAGIASWATATIPPEWEAAIGRYGMLAANGSDSVSQYPVMGSGFLGWQVDQGSMNAAGLYSGFLTSGPSHGAAIPVFSAFSLKPGASVVLEAQALDLETAMFLRRFTVQPASDCATAVASCTNGSAPVQVEVRYFIHRPLGGVYVAEVASLAPSGTLVRLQLAATGGTASSDLVIRAPSAAGLPDCNGCQVLNGTTAIAEANDSSVQPVAIAYDPVPAWVSLVGAEDALFATAVRTNIETAIVNASSMALAAVGDLNAAHALQAAGKLETTHAAAWAALGESGVFTDRPDAAIAWNASYYTLLSAVRADRPFGPAPGGITPGYNMHTFWDDETWMQPGLLFLQPDLAAACQQYRFNRRPGAREKAASYAGMNYTGCMWPWESAYTGEETCPSWAPTGLREIHISGDIALATWNVHRITLDPDLAFLETVGYPILSCTADFWVSKATIDTAGSAAYGLSGSAQYEQARRLEQDPKAPLHINDVIPPDEYHDHCNDSVYTNAVARLTLQFASHAASLLQRPAPESAAWVSAAPRIVSLFDAENLRHPEFAGYTGDEIKQADVVLMGFPLDLGVEDWGNESAAVRANDLAYYAARTSADGPAMTWGMHSIGYVELQDWDNAAANFNRSFANIHTPFGVWTETPSGGTVNFATGAGGAMQTFLNGYTGMRLRDDGLHLLPRRVPEGSSVLQLRGVSFGGCRLDIRVTTAAVSVAQHAMARPTVLLGKEVACRALAVTDESTGEQQPLAPGGSLSFQLGHSLLVHAADGSTATSLARQLA